DFELELIHRDEVNVAYIIQLLAELHVFHPLDRAKLAHDPRETHCEFLAFFLLAFFFGAFIGVNSGLFGAASGLVFVIALVIIYGYPLKKGVGTALILSMIISFSTFTIYQFLGIWIKSKLYFNFEISLFLAIGSIFTANITSSYVQRISAKIMGRAIGLIIIILGIFSLGIFFIS
ncbi:MAG: TSUP family transporter, partial [Candidatus Thorarchaeota archaeon]